MFFVNIIRNLLFVNVVEKYPYTCHIWHYLPAKIILFLKLPKKIMEKLEIFKQVGRNIQQIRQSKGLSQVDLVGRIEGNIDTTNISRIEQGRTNPTLLTLYRIAQALEVSLLDLVAIDKTKGDKK
jgi:hypothetical protein